MTSFVDEHGEWENRKISIVGTLQSFITQLSIGEDLTKMSIPSVLLTPYSMLELGASRGLNYVQYLLSANRETDPVLRLVGIARWYIAFTQQEKAGKKPYNPILAETHLAWVDSEKLEGGPFKGKTIFFAEQVTHHPPCTTYITINTEEKFKLETCVEFSTNFHGNSVTAHTNGPTHIYLQSGEKYTVSKGMPDMGIKNVIIGTRRHSWEGEVTITSEESGLQLVLNYFEEGWWCIGTVNGHIIRTSDPSKKLYTIVGPLSGVVNITNVDTNKTEVLVNNGALKNNKINYLPYDKLDHTSSLKIWKDLSEAIVKDDMYNADISKRAVEDSQRQRRRDNTSYVPSYFKLNEETKFWEFNYDKLKEIEEKIRTANDPVAAESSSVKPEEQ